MDRRTFFKSMATVAGASAVAGPILGPSKALATANASNSRLGASASDLQTVPDAFFTPDLIQPSDRTAADKLSFGQRTVLVVGGGLAGLSAALELAERGYKVTLKEGGQRFGGRLHTRSERLRTGTFNVEHGLHMWFYQYYNLQDVLQRLGTWEKYFVPFDEVHFQFRNYKPETIRSVGPYPLNLLNILAESSNLNLLDALGTVGGMTDITFYDHASNWQRFDHITFPEWAKRAQINPKFWDVIMEPAASVTLNDPQKVSAAEMLLYMHYYFIGNPKAFHRRIPTVDHGTAVIDPWVERLRNLGADMQLNSPVSGLRCEGGRVIGELIGGNHYDYVVLATDVPGTRRIVAASSSADRASEFGVSQLKSRINGLFTAPPYSVLRVWFDKPTRARPANQAVIETPQHRPINLIADYAMIEQSYAEWAKASGGAVLEFHLYNGPQFVGLGADQVWNEIRATALEIFPELSGARTIDFSLGSYDTFTSFSPGQGLVRPQSDFARSVGLENLGLAGDWVSTSYPTALMERAVSTGRECANAILRDDGIKEAPIQAAKKNGPGLLPQA